MARRENTLTLARIRRAGPGKLFDAFGLILRVRETGAKNWIWRGTVHGVRRELGLGAWPLVTLDAARELAFEYTREAKRGNDPRTLKQGDGVPTMADACKAVIRLHEPTWKHGRLQADRWRQSFDDYVLPRLGRRKVSDLTTADVMAVLLPIWTEKPSAAREVKQRLSTVFRWAIAEGLRTHDPAGAAIAAALPKVNGRENHKAVPHAEVSGTLAKIKASGRTGPVKLALEFLILTAARANEALGARWDEVDMDAATWTIPASRMKAKREHRVPLSTAAVEVLTAARELGSNDGLIFSSKRHGVPLSDASFRMMLRALKVEATVHGFRSSFRSWAADEGVSRDIAEAALAHVVRGVEGAYQRSDLMGRRRELMQSWADYVQRAGQKHTAI